MSARGTLQGAALIWSGSLSFHMWRWKPKDTQSLGRCKIFSLSPELSPLDCWSSKMNIHRNQEEPLKSQILGPNPRVSDPEIYILF